MTRAVQKATGTIPILFVNVSDPVGEGFVAQLARPDANLTGFINLEAEMGGKWVELLKELAPQPRTRSPHVQSSYRAGTRRRVFQAVLRSSRPTARPEAGAAEGAQPRRGGNQHRCPGRSKRQRPRGRVGQLPRQLT